MMHALASYIEVSSRSGPCIRTLHTPLGPHIMYRQTEGSVTPGEARTTQALFRIDVSDNGMTSDAAVHLLEVLLAPRGWQRHGPGSATPDTLYFLNGRP